MDILLKGKLEYGLFQYIYKLGNQDILQSIIHRPEIELFYNDLTQRIDSIEKLEMILYIERYCDSVRFVEQKYHNLRNIDFPNIATHDMFLKRFTDILDGCDLFNLLKGMNYVISGSSILRSVVLDSEFEHNDIDIFFINREDIMKFIDKMQKYNFTIINHSEGLCSVVNVLYSEKLTLQLILLHERKSLVKVTNEFDIDIVKIYLFEGEIMVHGKALECILKKRFTFDNLNMISVKNLDNLVNRIVKYHKRGFIFVREGSILPILDQNINDAIKEFDVKKIHKVEYVKTSWLDLINNKYRIVELETMNYLAVKQYSNCVASCKKLYYKYYNFITTMPENGKGLNICYDKHIYVTYSYMHPKKLRNLGVFTSYQDVMINADIKKTIHSENILRLSPELLILKRCVNVKYIGNYKNTFLSCIFMMEITTEDGGFIYTKYTHQHLNSVIRIRNKQLCETINDFVVKNEIPMQIEEKYVLFENTYVHWLNVADWHDAFGIPGNMNKCDILYKGDKIYFEFDFDQHELLCDENKLTYNLRFIGIKRKNEMNILEGISLDKLSYK